IYIIMCVRAACLVLFAVCQRSSFSTSGKAGKKMPPEPQPRPLPESECKGTPTFRNGKIFQELFSGKTAKREGLDKIAEEKRRIWTRFPGNQGCDSSNLMNRSALEKKFLL
ncbi:MAG: hypothetical protein J5616_04620, partial [Bacteroidaceae bacterium]|nr:hypothetical protein [Bacteroidaceae bacterium]